LIINRTDPIISLLLGVGDAQFAVEEGLVGAEDDLDGVECGGVVAVVVGVVVDVVGGVVVEGDHAGGRPGDLVATVPLVRDEHLVSLPEEEHEHVHVHKTEHYRPR
jgi:hypothetical protein